MSSATRKTSRSAPAWSRIVVLVLVFFVLFLSWRYTPLAEFATAERVMRWARSTGTVAWAPLAVVAVYTPAAFLMFPRPLITLFAVIAFGPWSGFAVSMTGIIGSALATYFVGRTLPDSAVRRVAGKKFEKTAKAVRQRGFVSVFAVTVAPVAPFPVVGMTAGAVRIKLRHYVLGTALGMTPGTLATTVFAHQIRVALEHPERINYWVVAGVLAVLVLLTLIVRRWMITVQQDA